MSARCEACGAELKRINVLKGRVLCDRCYEAESGLEGGVCVH